MSDEVVQREMTLSEWVGRLYEQHAARREYDALVALRAQLATASVCELAADNFNVASYMAHWEGRAEKAEADLADMQRQRDQWKEFAFKHLEITPPVVTQELAALRSRLSDLTAALVTTEKARDRWHQKYTVEAQARKDETQVLGDALTALRDRCATAEASYQEAQVVIAGLHAEVDHYKRARREP